MVMALKGVPQAASLVRAKMVLQDRRSSIYSKPPKTKIGPGQSFFIMSVFAVGMLAPAGWIMHHIPEYRQRPRPSSRPS
ncbi:COX8 domain-containing protein [Oncorhynchus nerka]|uniref:COX8 domain-containing protein n=1 Tax=Salvelinus namaycush TaxID=8040 RepID=A0A8U0PGU2_SALNM|nr:COX8 domain-containing protein [Oncorhynchus mykiss]XP_023829322.1 cytochrome c oxidase subunit 8B, mitochondrial-like [Salvelinus alpinus]XP_024276358.1 COX8 domain-containing protein [Oncorhynchus tshawytscha]XP_029486585.1 cytochrome c oxidase subunit 8B, mitochondrial-like [Oncorhynchus nerka]XP_035649863.1 COX8 domain-containing protein [Oncorhynchus keta]XP_038824047.1 COX8 domain-containing protein [Salvelinus namaycush]XP_046149260.1 COX8 domain-containing protein [Oncorhynchus gor